MPSHLRMHTTFHHKEACLVIAVFGYAYGYIAWHMESRWQWIIRFRLLLLTVSVWLTSISNTKCIVGRVVGLTTFFVIRVLGFMYYYKLYIMPHVFNVYRLFRFNYNDGHFLHFFSSILEGLTQFRKRSGHGFMGSCFHLFRYTLSFATT